jgi:L-ascorbate metabolism protein UlaG (beta-lactamase superfamily)
MGPDKPELKFGLDAHRGSLYGRHPNRVGLKLNRKASSKRKSKPSLKMGQIGLFRRRTGRRFALKALALAGATFAVQSLLGRKARFANSAMAQTFEGAVSDQELALWLAASDDRVKNSPQFRNGRFQNEIPAKEDMWNALVKWVGDKTKDKIPSVVPETVRRSKADFDTPPETGFRVTWVSHPKRFFEAPLALVDLPKLDAIILSHDHYDHLCRETVEWLRDNRVPFVTALGVGARLVKLGVLPSLVHEHDWWETNKTFGTKLVCTPARHFSGRTLWDRNKTLWTSWCVLGQNHRFFFSGDTAMFPGFKTIGEKYGPFDLVAMEAGAYNQAWPDVHIGPEQAVQAALDLKAKLMLPVHWATFPLSLHGWTEPGERILSAAQKRNLKVALPKPGQSFEPNSKNGYPDKKWWPETPWESAEQSPIVSTGLGA